VLAEPERTPYDLRFRLLGFPVRVHPWFWLGSVLLGANWLDRGVQYLAIWVGIVFVSILVHELGHALAFRLYGAGADIILYAFGGLAVPTHAISGRVRRIIVALAGPFAGFVLCGLVYGSNEALEWGATARGGAPNGEEVWILYRMLIVVNLYWGIFNLLPVYPLDGGQVSRELCGMWWGTRGTRVSLRVSIAVAALVAVYSIVCEIERRGGGAGLLKDLPLWFPRGGIYTAILFVLLAISSYQLLQQRDWTDDHWADDRVPWER
jgi:Zn-dependent protease